MTSAVPRILLLLCSAAFATAESNRGVYFVTDYGTKANGTSLDTDAFQTAINMAGKAGGGEVVVSPGHYLIGTVLLHSHVTLILSPGAVLHAADFKRRERTTPTNTGYNTPAVFMATDCEDIAIIGRGRIQGDGLERDSKPNPYAADKGIALWHCRNVVLRDFTILGGGHFAIYAGITDNLTIDNVTVDTERDGIDIGGCRNVRVSNCSINSPFDDGLCLKSPRRGDVTYPTEDVTMVNCAVSGYDVGTLVGATFDRATDFTRTAGPGMMDFARFGAQQRTRQNAGGPTGRIKFGTESFGGFKNITIANCTFTYCRGLAIEAVDGGDIDNVTVSNVAMRDTFTAPLFIRLGDRNTVSGHVSTIRHIRLSHLVVSSSDYRHGCIFSGIPGHPIEDVTLDDVQLVFPGGGASTLAATTPGELTKDYPEPFMFGDMPSFAFYVRHVTGLRMTNVSVTVVKPDARPALELEDVHGAVFNEVSLPSAPGGTIIRVRDASKLQIRAVDGLSDRFLGARVDHLELTNGNRER